MIEKISGMNFWHRVLFSLGRYATFFSIQAIFGRRNSGQYRYFFTNQESQKWLFPTSQEDDILHPTDLITCKTRKFSSEALELNIISGKMLMTGCVTIVTPPYVAQLLRQFTPFLK